MLSALPSLDRRSLFARLAGSASSITVVTSSRRLAQALTRAFGMEAASGGRGSWDTPDILPFAAWVERFWNEALYSEAAGELPLLLNEAQQQALWQECIVASGHDELLSLASAAQEALEAWRLAHAWQLMPRLAHATSSIDARAFGAWSTRYERMTRERSHIDDARLADRMAPLLREATAGIPAHVVLAGFDLLTPQQEAFLAAIRDAGASISALVPMQREGSARRVSFARPAEEIEAAARWCRARLEVDPRIRLGVVVPDLARSRRRVERIFARVLDPARGVADESAMPFNISLGLPLAQWPIAHDALALLRLCGREIAFEDASALLRSPFIAAAESERAAREALDAALRRRSPAEVSLDMLARMLARPGMPAVPRLQALLERLGEFRRSDLFQRRGAAEWARSMELALRHAGFPGERTLQSAEYQAWSKWHQALGDFAALEHVTGAMGYGEACERLARAAGAMLFQPETADVPIQVLGILESAGIDFDALWITGLSEDAWPMPPRPNPFIPIALQRAAGIPRADAAASLALDERITAGWKRCANEIVFSHVRMRDDAEVLPSPLVAPIAESEVAVLGLSHAATLRDALRGAGRLETRRDGRGPTVQATARAGGTRLFRDQAACPFRAFAHHRLASAPVERPEPGLDAAARGTLVHEMLARVWKAIGTKERLDALPAAELDALLATCADESIDACARMVADSLVGRFHALERERLVGTARDWLGHEARREPFEVIAIEEKREMTFGGITVHVKLDRMDELARGGRAVIDYKTGVAAVSSWLGERPDEPQLPMYTVGSGEDIRAVAFARLKRGDMGFCGFEMEEGLLPGKVRQVGKGRRASEEYAGWSEMVAGWRSRLDALGEEFARGEARVDPKAPSTCEQCDQHVFCRIAEKERARRG